MTDRSIYTVWFIWWSDKSSRFHVQEVRTLSKEYNYLIRKALAWTDEAAADAECARLNQWLDDSETMPLGVSVPVGPHLVRMT